MGRGAVPLAMMVFVGSTKVVVLSTVRATSFPFIKETSAVIVAAPGGPSLVVFVSPTYSDASSTYSIGLSIASSYVCFSIVLTDELGTLLEIDSLELIFSASRSCQLTMVPIIQRLGQLKKNYGEKGSEIIIDNCQDTIFGGFAPNSQTADELKFIPKGNFIVMKTSTHPMKTKLHQ